MSDSDQEKYSIDEMMDRLRTRGGGSKEGEPQLVTREDGTQVMRVRKRKRRSHQPHKEIEAKQRKRNLVLIALATVAILLIGLSVLGWVFYLNSKGYREGLEQKMAAWTGAEVRTTQFRATPVGMGAGLVEFSWPENQPAASLKLHGLQGDVSADSYFGTQLRGEQIVASGASTLTLRAASGAPDPDAALPEGECPFNFSYRAEKLNVRFGEGSKPALVLSESEASFLVPDPAVKSGNLVLQGGKARVFSWGTYLLDFASIQISQDGVEVGNVELVPEGAPDAQVRLRGDQLPPILTRGGKNELRFQLKEMPSTFLLGGGLGGLIDAKFETPSNDLNTGRLFFDVTDPASPLIDSPIQVTLSSILRLQGFSFFGVLADELGDDQIARARFESEGRAQLKKTPSETRLERISFVSQALIKIEGELTEKAGGVLDGTLEIGLPNSTISGAGSAAIKSVFNRPNGAYHWARVRISGTTAKPVDDLAEQLQAALRSTSPASSGRRGLDDEFRDLTTPR